MLHWLKRWYRGYMIEEDVGHEVPFFRPYRHWTARLAAVVVQGIAKNWLGLVTLIVTAVGAVAAVLALK